MKVVGEAAARGSAETVWDALHDAAVLARAIPGCERFEIRGPGLGQFTATTTLPAIGGTYAGTLTVAEQQRPSLLRLTASAAGDQGAFSADVTVRLSDTAEATVLAPRASGTVLAPRASGTVLSPRASGTVLSPRASGTVLAPRASGTVLSPRASGTTTLVSFEANGTVTGSLAGVGTRLLASAAKRLAEGFFAVIDESVAAAAAPAATPDAAEPVRPVSDAGRPNAVARPAPAADGRAALLAGAAIGLTGVIIGVLAGRRGRRAGRVGA